MISLIMPTNGLIILILKLNIIGAILGLFGLVIFGSGDIIKSFGYGSGEGGHEGIFAIVCIILLLTSLWFLIFNEEEWKDIKERLCEERSMIYLSTENNQFEKYYTCLDSEGIKHTFKVEEEGKDG